MNGIATGLWRRLAGAPFKFLFSDFDDRRQKRKDDDDRNDLVNVVVNVGNHLTEKVTAKHRSDHPADTTGDVVDDKPFVFHRADAGDDRRERSKNRYEPGDDNREGSVALIEFFGGDEMLAVKK